MEDPKVEHVMTRLVVKFAPTDSVRDAAARLAQNDITGAPVVADGRVVGVVSEVDLVRAEFWAQVSRVMSTHLVTISPGAGIADAAMTMERHRVKRLPVLDDQGYLLGIVSRGDVVRAIADRGSTELRVVSAGRT